jgi:lactate permease
VNPIFTWNYAVEGLHNLVNKVPPVVPQLAHEPAVFAFTYLSFTGTGMLIAAIISGVIMGFSPLGLLRAYGRTIWLVRYSLITISAMLAIGTLTRYSGVDATLGLAFAHAGFLYSAGSASRSPVRTPRQMCCSAACRRSPRSSLDSRRS